MEPPAAPDTATVLVVDDTPENVDVLAGILRGHYQIKIALNGEKALKIATGDQPPDLVLLDVMMPEMDGYEVCRLLHEDPRTRDIPVVFVTAKSEIEDETKGFEIGAVDYITKPVSPAIVLARVRNHLALRNSRRKLAELSDKLSRYLSPQIYQSIFEGRQDARIGSSRKKLTVFFSDIVGFTRQTDGMEAEDLAYILNGYLNRMAGIVLKHGGTLDKFIGDAVLVFFGDPESKGISEDAIACVRMALEMQAAVDDLGREWAARGIGKGFAIRVGIATGFCTVGNFGSDQRMDYTIIGSQVNLASRLEGAAEPGTVLISQETWLLVRDEFECVAMPPISVKGFDEPVQTYRVTATDPGPRGQLGIHAASPGFSLDLSPAALTGEEREAVIAKLREAINCLR